MMKMRSFLPAALGSTAVVLLLLTACRTSPASSDPYAYVNLAVGSTWTYHLSVTEGAAVIFDPIFVNPPGILGSSATHGSARVKYPERDFTITVTGMISETEAGIEISDLSAIPWIPLDAAGASLVLVEKEGGDLSYEIRISPLGAEDWILSQYLAVIPHDPAQAGMQEIETPAGTFQALHLVLNHPAVQDYSPEYVQETWLAEGVGMVRSVTRSNQNELIYTLELIDYAVK